VNARHHQMDSRNEAQTDNSTLIQAARIIAIRSLNPFRIIKRVYYSLVKLRFGNQEREPKEIIHGWIKHLTFRGAFVTTLLILSILQAIIYWWP
jgi:hypothetical protein